ncbi:MAG: YcaQ family DNA glycosylase [Rubellimicrobium sp.]|nr:YcaQ family DNA glycosylase [Rubellimicrobium sp.]
MRHPTLDNRTARRIFLAHHGIGTAAPADAAAAIRALGFVQVDSVNTVARAHDLVLWSRFSRWRPEMLGRLTGRNRQVFEHWTHDASILPVEHFPHWRLRFARDAERLAARWRQWQGDAFEGQFDTVLRRIADHGECTSGELAEGGARGSTGWWDWHPSKAALEYLWRVGEVSVVRREGFRKVYDLTERVIPPEHLNARPRVEETVDWACNAALDRLGFATPKQLAAFWDLVTAEEARGWAKSALAEGRVVEVLVTGSDGTGSDGTGRHILMRPEVLEAGPAPDPGGRVRVLSPFDPALRDRARAEWLFGFHYRIEIYVPEPQRRYGYYVFPVLEGDRLIGRIDMKADRASGVLAVRAFWPEAGVAMGSGRRGRIGAELGRVARLAGCRDITGWNG